MGKNNKRRSRKTSRILRGLGSGVGKNRQLCEVAREILSTVIFIGSAILEMAADGFLHQKYRVQRRQCYFKLLVSTKHISGVNNNQSCKTVN